MSKEDISICMGPALSEGTESAKCALPWEEQAERLGTVFSFNARAPQCFVLPPEEVWFYFFSCTEFLFLP